MSPDIIEKYRKLIRKLYEKTNSNSIEWFTGRNSDFYCEVSSNYIHVRATRDADGEPLEIIEIRNSDDEVVDTFYDTDVGGVSPGISGFVDYYTLMTSLRQAARRNAHGADKALDDILGDLDG